MTNCRFLEPMIEILTKESLAWWKVLTTNDPTRPAWPPRRRHSLATGDITGEPDEKCSEEFFAEIFSKTVYRTKPKVEPCIHDGRRKPITENCCPVCLGTLMEGDLVWCKNGCGHNFHAECWTMHEEHFQKQKVQDDGDFDEEKQLLCILCRCVWLDWRCQCDKVKS